MDVQNSHLVPDTHLSSVGVQQAKGVQVAHSSPN